MLFSARSSYDDAKKAGCPSVTSVDCGSKANSVASSNKVSQVLYVSAAIAAVAGGTMLFIAPGPTGATQVGLITRVVF